MQKKKERKKRGWAESGGSDLTINGSVTCDPHHTSRNIFLFTKNDPFFHQRLFVFGTSDRTADVAGCDVIDADALFPAAAAGRLHKSKESCFGCFFGVSLFETSRQPSTIR